MLPNNTAAYDPPRSCAQGSIPRYYVDVAKVSDVQTAVMFAKTNSIPLVIKNSGHDFAGRSSAPGGLVGCGTIRIYHSSEISFPLDALTAWSMWYIVFFGAGANFDALYKFADADCITLPDGTEPTVGAGDI